MKVFIAGDHRTGTGPANVTKEYITSFPKTEKVLYQKMVSKITRVPEMIVKVAACDVVLFSGYSKQNLLGIKLAKFFKKPTAYLMHGCVEYENEINGVPDPVMVKCERATISGVDRVYAVSERFEKWLKDYYPENADKFGHVYNGVEKPSVKKSEPNKETAESEQYYRIFSIGGGMPRKMIKYICSALEILIEQGTDVRLVVVGDKGLDTEEINAYSFVDNQGLVSSDRVRELFGRSHLFIQNSCFETFGLAPVEALSNGCSVLLSDWVGALDIINNVQECDIIKNYNDSEEIAEKIRYLLEHPNGERLLGGIDFDRCSWENRGKELCRALQELLKN